VSLKSLTEGGNDSAVMLSSYSCFLTFGDLLDLKLAYIPVTSTLTTYCVAVLIGALLVLSVRPSVRPSVCLSVSPVRSPNSKTKKRTKHWCGDTAAREQPAWKCENV